MSNTSQETGQLTLNSAVDSLLAVPPVEDTEDQRRQEQEAAQPAEAEAEAIGEDTPIEEPSEDVYEDEAEEVEELEEAEDVEEEVEEPLYTVAIDGEQYEVTLDELQKGYSRQQVFTKRSQEVAEQRKAVEQQQTEVTQMRDYYASQLEQVASQIQQTLPEAEPDWQALKEQGYSAEDLFIYKTQIDQQKENLRKVNEEKERVAQQQAQEQQVQMQKHLSAQREEMLNRLPQWRDDDIRDSERKQVITYAKSVVGFSDQEIANATDARAIELLYKAWQWDNLQKKKPAAKKKAGKAPRMAKAGQPKTKAQVASRQRQQANQRLTREKSVEAAVDLLMGR